MFDIQLHWVDIFAHRVSRLIHGRQMIEGIIGADNLAQMRAVASDDSIVVGSFALEKEGELRSAKCSGSNVFCSSSSGDR